MTSKERNRDIKRLGRKIVNYKGSHTQEFEQEIQDEVRRLYRAGGLSSLSTRNLIILWRVNQRFGRPIPMHLFGIHEEIKDLI